MKMLVAKERSPRGAGLANARGTYGILIWSRGEMVACFSKSVALPSEIDIVTDIDRMSEVRMQRTGNVRLQPRSGPISSFAGHLRVFC